MAKVVFTAAAETDLREAAEFYAAIRPLHGTRFANAIDQALAKLAHSPRIGHKTFLNCRKLRLNRLPYFFVYTLETTDTVVIHAFVHERREPTHWHPRLHP